MPGVEGVVYIGGMMRIGVAALVAALAACGSKSSSSSPTTTPGDPVAAVELPDVPFDQLDHDQKIEFMKQKVMPAMEPIFKNHDATKFAEFTCKTCHGEGAAQGEFHMPNDKLPKLNFADPSQHKKEDMEWMSKQVKPQMAALLKETEYSPENPEGFGCLHCHTAAQ